jgi:predicted RND superfamily exporter protein
MFASGSPGRQGKGRLLMSLSSEIVARSVRHYKAVTWTVIVVTLLVAVVAAAPSVFPNVLSFLSPVKVDTDPENMLSADEPVRLFHNRMKRVLNLHDMVVVGIVNDQDPNGVFNVSTLRKVYDLAEFAKKLKGAEIGQPAGSGAGVIDVDLLSLSTVDSIEPSANGVSFSKLMPQPPADDKAALEVWRKARRVPFLFGTLLSDKDPNHPGQAITTPSKAIAMYLPLTAKDLSHAVYVKLQAETAKLGGPEKFHVTGLPVAEDTFGVEMFIQMAISAPAAMLVIFLLMLAFFRKLVLIVAPMIVAMVSVIITMGALIIAGFPVHIMSSMIPIFIMPIAVLDSIHIISEFFERYQATRDREKTIRTVMAELFQPMLYTSLTSTAGFASEALAPIPPVQVFGLFVAFGIMVAWVLTVTFIPAFVMFINPAKLANFGAVHAAEDDALDQTALGRFLRWVAGVTYRRAKIILVATLLVMSVAGYGISRININDNPVKWFEPSHPIRQADTVLNKYFGGTYMAYLAVQYEPAAFDANTFAADLHKQLARRSADVSAEMARLAPAAGEIAAGAGPADADSELFLAALKKKLTPPRFGATDEQLKVWGYPEKFLNIEADRFRPAGASPLAFDGVKYAEALRSLSAEHAKRFADNIQKLDKLVDAAAATKPASRDAMLELLAGRYSGVGSDAVRRSSSSDALAPAGQAGTLQTGEPALPVIGQPAESGATKPSGYALTGTLQTNVYAAAAEDAVSLYIDEIRQQSQVFKRPDVLRWMGKLQAAMGGAGTVGKSNSLVDMVETVHRDLLGGDPNEYRVPSNSDTVANCIEQFQSGSPDRRNDIWHFVTTDFQTASIWVQLTSGDNRDMQKVVEAVKEFAAANPSPVPTELDWFGLTYINVVWQDNMVTGMLEAFLGSFLVVLLLMVILFRSVLWGLLSMIPLTVTIAAIYGTIGLAGKDYDMPVAVLSSLTLGLAVDFAIHFLSRARTMHGRYGSWQQTLPHIFGEPARAITRNIIVIAAGFLPLLLAPLVPYQTVGVLLAVILLVGGATTLILLPALIRTLERGMFISAAPMSASCNCGVCIVSAVVGVAIIVMSVKPYVPWQWSTLTWLGAAAVPAAAAICGIMSRRQKCKMSEQPKQPDQGAIQ